MTTISLGTPREPVVSAFLSWDPGPIALAGNEMHFDVVIAEEHDNSSEITQHPVEQGVNIIDHVRPNATRLMLEVFVSNTPVWSADTVNLPLTLDYPKPSQDAGFLSIINGGSSALLDKGLQALGILAPTPTQISPTVDQFAGDTDYVSNIWDQMNSLRTTAKLLSVTTPRAYYSNMVLYRCSMHRDAQVGTGARFELEMMQIRIVSSAVVDAPLPAIVTATPTQNLGKKDAKRTPPAKMQSVAKHLGEGGTTFKGLISGTTSGGP